MLSRNFYRRIIYQLDNKAIFKVFFHFFLDRITHPFNSSKKKKDCQLYQSYLMKKKISLDYFSNNAYYWNQIINKNFDEFSYLEIGSWEGGSASYILNNYKTKKVFCVDIWDKFDDEYKEDHFKRFENFKFNMDEFKGKFSFFKNTSDEFFMQNKEKFDLIYIDGWHEAPQVYKDINNSWNSLNINGIIICDDYFYGNINVRNNSTNKLPALAINKFILEKRDELKIICVNNSQIFFKKII